MDRQRLTPAEHSALTRFARAWRTAAQTQPMDYAFMEAACRAPDLWRLIRDLDCIGAIRSIRDLDRLLELEVAA